jgi:hypothetical protein
MKGTVLRVVSGGAVSAVLMLMIALPASAAVTTPTKPTVEIVTPDAGAYFRRGSIWVVGIACDPNASMSDSTAGIAKVSVYIGDRDDPTVHSGRGDYVGSASLAGTLGTGSGIDITAVLAETSRLGIGNPDVSVCKNPNAGWRVLTSALKKGSYDLHIYTLAKNGAETLVTRSVRIDMP